MRNLVTLRPLPSAYSDAAAVSVIVAAAVATVVFAGLDAVEMSSAAVAAAVAAAAAAVADTVAAAVATRFSRVLHVWVLFLGSQPPVALQPLRVACAIRLFLVSLS